MVLQDFANEVVALGIHPNKSVGPRSTSKACPETCILGQGRHVEAREAESRTCAGTGNRVLEQAQGGYSTIAVLPSVSSQAAVPM